MKKINILFVGIAIVIAMFGAWYAGVGYGVKGVCDIYMTGFYSLDIGETGYVYEGNDCWQVTRIE